MVIRTIEDYKKAKLLINELESFENKSIHVFWECFLLPLLVNKCRVSKVWQLSYEVNKDDSIRIFKKEWEHLFISILPIWEWRTCIGGRFWGIVAMQFLKDPLKLLNDIQKTTNIHLRTDVIRETKNNLKQRWLHAEMNVEFDIVNIKRNLFIYNQVSYSAQIVNTIWSYIMRTEKICDEICLKLKKGKKDG